MSADPQRSPMEDAEGADPDGQKAPGYDVCNARLKQYEGEKDRPKRAPGPWAGEGYCQRPAGAGTNLDGGRCWTHGGRGAEASVRHGLYAKSVPEGLAERIEALMQDRGELEDGGREVAVSRAIFEETLRTALADGVVAVDTAEDLTRIADRIAKGAARLKRERRREGLVFSLAELEQVIHRIIHVLRRHAPEEVVEAVGADLARLNDTQRQRLIEGERYIELQED